MIFLVGGGMIYVSLAAVGRDVGEFLKNDSWFFGFWVFLELIETKLSVQ